MNIRRGLIRLWIFGSAIWITGVAVVAMEDPDVDWAIVTFRAPAELYSVKTDADYEGVPTGAKYRAPDGTIRQKLYSVKIDADYESVPAGAKYRAPDGTIRQKPYDVTDDASFRAVPPGAPYYVGGELKEKQAAIPADATAWTVTICPWRLRLGAPTDTVCVESGDGIIHAFPKDTDLGVVDWAIKGYVIRMTRGGSGNVSIVSPPEIDGPWTESRVTGRPAQMAVPKTPEKPLSTAGDLPGNLRARVPESDLPDNLKTAPEAATPAVTNAALFRTWLWKYISLALGLPLICLVFGSGVWWVASGFLRNPKSS